MDAKTEEMIELKVINLFVKEDILPAKMAIILSKIICVTIVQYPEDVRDDIFRKIWLHMKETFDDIKEKHNG